jgi:tetratricopeptide (TPR) repeat protein
MRRSCVIAALTLAVAATPALASFGGGSSTSPPPPTTAPPASGPAQTLTARQQAEETYGLAYQEVAKAKKDVAAGKSKNAEKKFHRALERGERAVELDSTYHEAWNLVGYCARHVGRYDQAFAAYARCLSIKPDYAPALEYLGEAWLERGDPTRAREQLAALEKLGASEAAELKAQIEKYEAAHPAATAPKDDASAGGAVPK